MYEVESGTILHTLQEDQDILDQDGQIASNAKGKIGNYFTLNILTDPT